MSTKRAARAPKALREGGKKLWNRVLREFELADHEEVILLQACRLLDTLDRLQEQIDAGDVIVESPQGPKTHPAVVEFRQHSLSLAKVVASLRIPFGEDELVPQQRSGARRASMSSER